jgi:hypothetical protein
MPETDGDVSASTARVQAFKERGDELPPSWRMKAPRSSIGVLALIVLAVAILLGLFGSLLIG